MTEWLCVCGKLHTNFPCVCPDKNQRIELSKCSVCECMTWTVQKPALSGSENVHYRYECGKCGFKKELEIINYVKKKSEEIITKNGKRLIKTCLQDRPSRSVGVRDSKESPTKEENKK